VNARDLLAPRGALRRAAALRVGAAAVCLGLAQASAFAADVQAGREKSAVCSVCHGANGMGQAPDVPHLAAQPAIYLAAQLKAFRSGARKHEVMAVMAKPLSDADIDNLAAWYNSIQIEIKPVP
jgi:cytochrome c553